MAALNKTIQLVGDKILKRSCGLTRMLSCSNALKSSKIVDSEVMDLQLPNLSFHDMCWSRKDKWGGRAALVSGHLTLILYSFETVNRHNVYRWMQ